MTALPHGQLTIIVRPSTRDKVHPLTAYLAGTQIEGCGETVQRAVEDLFTSEDAWKVCKRLEEDRP